MAAQNDEELVTALALAHEYLAVGRMSLSRQLGQPQEMRRVEIAEERHSPQQGELPLGNTHVGLLRCGKLSIVLGCRHKKRAAMTPGRGIRCTRLAITSRADSRPVAVSNTQERACGTRSPSLPGRSPPGYYVIWLASGLRLGSP